MAVNVRKDKLSIAGEEHVTWYRSSENVNRGFCCRCGSTLFWKPELEGYEWISVAMGLFDEPIRAKLAKHTFFGEKGAYYDVNDDAVKSDDY